MKIKLINGQKVDTDNLDDRRAEIYEAINTFYEVCKKYNITGYAVSLYNKEGLGTLYLPSENDKLGSFAYVELVNYISEWLNKTSDGRLFIIDRESQEEHGEDFNHQ